MAKATCAECFASLYIYEPLSLAGHANHSVLVRMDVVKKKKAN